MALNINTLNEFCARWIDRSQHTSGNGLFDAYDRFFALWVVYNRLYYESARILIFENRAPFEGRSDKLLKQNRPTFSPPPDKLSATKGVTMFCGCSLNFPKESVEFILATAKGERFFFHENYNDLSPNKQRDKELAENPSISNILSLIYQARCNLFHGQKELDPIQIQLLQHMSSVIEHTVEVLLRELENHESN